jgi:hypothetical protein
MRVICRFVGDGASAQFFLRRNAGTVPGKRFSARGRLTLPRGEIHGFKANAHLNVAVRELVAKFVRQARERKRHRVDAMRRIDKSSHQSGGPMSSPSERILTRSKSPHRALRSNRRLARFREKPLSESKASREKRLVCLHWNTTLI